MRNLLCALVFLLLVTEASLPQQEINLPPSINNEFFNQCEGTWISEPYNFWGMSWTDEISLKWILNGQFMQLNGISKAENGFSMKSMVILSVDSDRNVKSWGFDEFGGEVAYFEGKINGMILTMEGGTKNNKGKYTLEINSNTMNQRGEFTVVDPKTGNRNVEEFEITYKKVQ